MEALLRKIADLLIRVGGIAYILAFLFNKLPMNDTADDRSVYTIGLVIALVIVTQGLGVFIGEYDERKEVARAGRNREKLRRKIRREFKKTRR